MAIKGGHLSLPVIQDVTKFQNSDLLLKEPRYGPKLDMEQLSEAKYERSLIYGLSDKTK